MVEVRTYRSIKRLQLPFVTKVFYDHSIEDLNVLIDDNNIQNLDKLIHNYWTKLNSKIKKYNENAISINNIFLSKLKNLSSISESKFVSMISHEKSIFV